MLEGVVLDDAEVFNDKLREWEDYYNTIDPTAASTAKLPTNASSRRPTPRRKRSTSVAHI
jgi:hypothetical protein